jgi:hypothetical protein
MIIYVNFPKKTVPAPYISDDHLCVVITHPTTSLPAKDNEATELGCEVNPSSRDGASARFDLKSN